MTIETANMPQRLRSVFSSLPGAKRSTLVIVDAPGSMQ